jgi:hypothetical protein
MVTFMRTERCREVIVPDVVLHGLEVPAPLARLDIEGDDAVPEEVVSRAESPVEVHHPTLGGDVDETQFGIGRHGSPGSDVPGPGPCVVFPGFVADSPGLGITWNFHFMSPVRAS